ncbi:MAG: hypothetical protein JWN95_3020 [Frankiales bacterium]|nr:hypothetical protein [Frankiales bacterium]
MTSITGAEPADVSSAFWMNLPDGWVVLDLDTKDVPVQLQELMDDAQSRDASFADHRGVLEKQIKTMIRSARSSDVSFAAILATFSEGGLPVSASLTVSLHDAPEAADAHKILSEIDADNTEVGRSNRVIELPYVGNVVRSAYLQNMNYTSFQGNAKNAIFQYFIPLPDNARRIAVVTGVTPTLPLTEAFGGLFDAVLSTFQFIAAPK